MQKLYPIVKLVVAIALIIGGLCGLLLAGLGVGAYLDAIDLGPDFASVDPLYLILGGLGMPIGAWFGWLRFKWLYGKATGAGASQ